jgi:hypothetical protein
VLYEDFTHLGVEPEDISTVKKPSYSSAVGLEEAEFAMEIAYQPLWG